jgi:hypothetical protein
MKVINKDSTYMFDVDSTLIFWIPAGQVPPADAICVDYYGENVYLLPHDEHIQLLKASVARGRNTVVWSGNGFQWCENVLKALKLDELDLTVMSKPAGYVDDLPCGEWMGNRIYLHSKNSKVEE